MSIGGRQLESASARNRLSRMTSSTCGAIDARLARCSTTLGQRDDDVLPSGRHSASFECLSRHKPTRSPRGSSAGSHCERLAASALISLAIRTIDGAEDQGAILHAAAHRTDLVHAPAERHRAVSTDAAESGTQAGDAAAGRWRDDAEPMVSVPMEKPTKPAAVAAPGPADEPLLPSLVSQGFLVVPPYQTSPLASAPRVSLAMSTAPASSRRPTTVASRSITWSL